MREFNDNSVFAAYSLPASRDYTLIIQEDEAVPADKLKNAPSFVFHPFDKCEKKYQLRPDFTGINVPFTFSTTRQCTQKDIEPETYISDVEATINRIKDGAVQKVVLSRTKSWDIPGSNISDLFYNLVGMQPDAFVYMINIPGEGCWMGASPELLINKVSENTYTTVALAGTQMNFGQNLDFVSWGEKELDEQSYVGKFVREQFDDHDINFKKTGKSTISAGEVLHIRSSYKINHDQLSIFDMAEILHPGPAIAGYPVADALDVIRDSEKHERKYYCGYLGPVGLDGHSCLFINLRCMQIYEGKASLYIGGGITSASDPSKEWAETDIKSRTLISVLNLSTTSV